jgi:hypothetical protein
MHKRKERSSSIHNWPWALVEADKRGLAQTSALKAASRWRRFVTDNAADTIEHQQVRRDQHGKASAQVRRQRAGGKRSGSSSFRPRAPSDPQPFGTVGSKALA